MHYSKSHGEIGKSFPNFLCCHWKRIACYVFFFKSTSSNWLKNLKSLKRLQLWFNCHYKSCSIVQKTFRPRPHSCFNNTCESVRWDFIGLIQFLCSNFLTTSKVLHLRLKTKPQWTYVCSHVFHVAPNFHKRTTIFSFAIKQFGKSSKDIWFGCVFVLYFIWIEFGGQNTVYSSENYQICFS